MASINPTRVVRGPISAEDWPPKEITFEAFYLIVMGDVPIGKQGYAPAIPIYTTTIQWQWAIMGSNLKETTKGRNRGDRYRITGQMEAELQKATYPNTTEKVRLSVDDNGQLQAELLGEWILWTPPEFHSGGPESNGVVFCTATEHITSMLPENVLTLS